MTCGVYITDFHWCGQFWCGGIIKCNECQERELRMENLQLQNKLLKKELKK